jgi:GNAT superfamily N-acetyltransferase
MNEFKSSDIRIQPIGLAEIDTLISYRLAYLEEMQGQRDAAYTERLQANLKHYFTEALEEDRIFAFRAEQNGESVSFGAMVLKKIPGDFNNPFYLEGDILNMYTVPLFRRKGISAMILEKLIEEAKKRGVSKVSLHTSKDGEKLYRKFGFSEPVYPVLELCL